jgi:hypothetical protein
MLLSAIAHPLHHLTSCHWRRSSLTDWTQKDPLTDWLTDFTATVQARSLFGRVRGSPCITLATGVSWAVSRMQQKAQRGGSSYFNEMSGASLTFPSPMPICAQLRCYCVNPSHTIRVYTPFNWRVLSSCMWQHASGKNFADITGSKIRPSKSTQP